MSRTVESRGFGAARGFTLIELLTVIAIIALLAAILVPRFWMAQERARVNACEQNLKNMATALQVYANENQQTFPVVLDTIVPNWMAVIPTCPAAQKNTYSSGYTSIPDPANFTVACSGLNHEAQGYAVNQPFYVFGQGLVDQAPPSGPPPGPPCGPVP